MFARPVSAMLQYSDFRSSEAEEEEVVRSHFLTNFYVSSVHGADGQRAIHRKLHVSGSRRLLAGGRDLLREVGGGIDHLASFNVEVGNESHLQAVASDPIRIDGRGDRVDQFDDQLRHEIAGSSLAAKNHRSRADIRAVVPLQPLKQRDYV